MTSPKQLLLLLLLAPIILFSKQAIAQEASAFLGVVIGSSGTETSIDPTADQSFDFTNIDALSLSIGIGSNSASADGEIGPDGSISTVAIGSANPIDSSATAPTGPTSSSTTVGTIQLFTDTQ